MNAPAALVQQPRRTFRLAVVAGSVALALAGTLLIFATRAGGGEPARSVATTLQVPRHPGAVAAGSGALWVALNGVEGEPAAEKPLLRVELGTGTVQRTVAVAGEATSLTRVGDLLVAAVRQPAEPEVAGRRLVALDWRTGRMVAERAFDRPIDKVVVSSADLWALSAESGTLLRLDARTLAPTSAPLQLASGHASDVAAAAGYLWVAAAEEGELLRIDPTTLAIRRVEVGGVPERVAVAGTSVWYADSSRGAVGRRDVETLEPIGDPLSVGGHPSGIAAAGSSLFVARDDGTVSRIDAATGRVGDAVRITPRSSAGAVSMATAGGSVWVSSGRADTVTRVVSEAVTGPSREVFVATPSSVAALPRGARLVAAIPVPPGDNAFAVGADAVWVMNNDSSMLLRIDPNTNAVVARRRIVDPAADIAVGAGALWITHPGVDTVSRVDASTNAVTATIPVGAEPMGIAVTGDAVWVSNALGNSVSRIDPRTNRVVATIPVGARWEVCCSKQKLTASGGDVWVAVGNLDALVRIDPETNTATQTVGVPFTPCADVVADDDAVWASGGTCGDLVGRLDRRTRKLASVLYGERHPNGLALAFGSLWVSASFPRCIPRTSPGLRAASVDRVDPQTGRILSRLRVGGHPVAVRAGFGSIWVEDDWGRILRLQPES